MVDTFGPRRMMLLGNLVQAAGTAAYLWTDSLLTVALWTALINLGRQAFWGSFGNVCWGIGGAIAPLAFTWLLTHGQSTVWWVLAVIALAGAAYVQTLPRVLPAAGVTVTNRSG